MGNTTNFFVNPYAIPMFFVSAFIFVTGLFILFQNLKNKTNFYFFSLCIAIDCWLAGNALVFCSKSPEISRFIYKLISFFGVVHLAPCVFAFSVSWLELDKKQGKYVRPAFLISAFFYLVSLTTPYGVPAMRHFFWGNYPIYGPSNQIYLLFFFIYFIASFYNFFHEFRTTKDPVRKKQVQIISIAFFIAFIGSVDYISKIFPVEVYPIGYICALFWVLGIAFSIVKYRALDIQTVVHKTLMWLLASSVLGAPMVGFFYFRKDYVYQLPPSIYLGTLIFSFISIVLYTRHIQPRIDHLFQRRVWDLSRAMEKFNDGLVDLRVIEEVTRHILQTVQHLFYATHVTLLIRNDEEAAFTEYSMENLTQDEHIRLPAKSTFIQWLGESDRLIFQEYLSLDPRLQSISEEGKKYFSELKANLCIPMVVNKRLLGILNLGQKQNLRRYTPSEVNFLNEFRRSAAIALSNILHVMAVQENLRKWNEELEQKVRERTDQLQDTQAQLVQAEKLATIGTLAGGVAHEINNPLTAVLTNAQILKMDANPEDIESLDLIEEGAKRCQTIIQNLLKYARKSEVESVFSNVDVHKIIQNVCSLLFYQLKQDNVDVEVNLEKVSPISGISNELEQVITNLLINARDAVKNKPQGEKKTILITARQKISSVEIVVEDNGAGMPEHVMGKIFDPFFTTKDVGGGTGLGLAVSYGIIQKHKGRVTVTSQVGRGSVFTLTFPKADILV